MKFIKLSEDEFRAFADDSPYKSFMQTPEIAKLREASGWTPHYYGVKDDAKILAATMLVSKPTILNYQTFYAPGGPLLNLEDKTLTDFFFAHLKSELKSKKASTLKIDPYYELIERDRSGHPVEGGFNHEKALKNLKNLGFKPQPDTTQPKYLFVIDLKNRTPDQLIADFKRNTRNHIKKAEKMGVQIRELKREELPIFKAITESTSKRRGFEDRPLSYYEQMYDLFVTKGEAKFLLAETSNSVSVVPLSAAMFITYGDEVIYLFSGSDEKYMKEYNAQYLIQWHMIKYAATNGFKIYNFYGIGGLPDPNSEHYGIYDFKKGFGGANSGRVVELIGSFELSLSPIDHAHKLLKKIKHKKA